MSEIDWYQKSNSEIVPKIRQELLIERLPSEMSFQKDNHIENFIGSSITLPGEWEPSFITRGLMKMTIFSSNDSASLVLMDRGFSATGQSTNYFKNLLSETETLSKPKQLVPNEIRDLASVMGCTTIGDNQYVNKVKPPDPRSPAFHIFSAALIPLNGKAVLEVQGHFVSETGAKGKEFRGIFVPEKNNTNRIQEFFLQADNAIDAAKHRREYNEALHSIKW